MASSYEIQQYLLDRANIHDTVTRLTFYYDTCNIDGFVTDVFAKEVAIDYKDFLGSEPFTTSGKDWASQLGKLLDTFSSFQHVTTGVIINLPQPGPSGAPRPDTATVDTQVLANLIRKAGGGDHGPGRELEQNGGRYRIELVRDPALEAEGRNPWRISKHVAIKVWARTHLTDEAAKE